MNWFLVPLEVLWLLPVWIWCALSCKSIAGCKSLSGGDWFFRGMLFHALAAGRLLALSPVSADSKDQRPDPFADPVARDVAVWLLVLLSIPILCGLAVIIAACCVGDAASVLNVCASLQIGLWLPLVWISSIIAAGRVARYKGADARSWSAAAAVGFVVPVALLLNLRSEEGSEAEKNKFLEDPRAKKILNTLMIGLLVPFALGLLAAVLVFVGLCVWRGLMTLHWVPETAIPISLQPGPVLLCALIFSAVFSSWLLSGMASCLMARTRGRNVVLWTILGFASAGFAPLVLTCFKPVPQSQKPDGNDVNSSEHFLVKWLVAFALFPGFVVFCWVFVAWLIKQFDPIQQGSEAWDLFNSVLFSSWTFSQFIFFVLVPLTVWFMMRTAKAAGTKFRLLSFASPGESMRSLALITIWSVELMQIYGFLYMLRHSN